MIDETKVLLELVNCIILNLWIDTGEDDPADEEYGRPDIDQFTQEVIQKAADMMRYRCATDEDIYKVETMLGLDIA